MPSCNECSMLVGNECESYKSMEKMIGRAVPPPPVGGCEIPIVKGYLPLIQPGMRVLEIGCGAWAMIKDYCKAVGAEYEGIDTVHEYFGKPSVATRFENLADLSLPDNTFDLVIGNQTMEHWAENGCTTEWGLYQCFRVCKVGGKVLLNVPIHFHGTEIFLMGRLEKVQSIFKPFSDSVVLESWGHDSNPIPAYFPYPGYRQLENKPAYLLDIQAVKDKPMPVGYTNRGAVSGVLARLIHHPFSYNLHRVYELMRKSFKVRAMEVQQ